MGSLGKVRIGHRAPDFHCDAVVRGLIEEVTLSSYICEKKKQWLILLFIPAAFSFVCPTEVLAFQNCLDEFKDRNCDVVFVSVDTKHSLWHWQNVPRQYGGLGQIDISLLSDASHKMSRDYGVLIEEEGICLRGMYILDDSAIVQQVTLNNLTVGRSVLEALRLLEAFQAVAKHGVLCPIDWKPSTNSAETVNTISNTLTESYDERVANLQKEFGDTPLTDLDAKHAKAAEEKRKSEVSLRKSSSTNSGTRSGNASVSSSLKSSDSSSTKRSKGDDDSPNSRNVGKDILIQFDEAINSNAPTPSATTSIHRQSVSPATKPRNSLEANRITMSAHSAPASASATPVSTPTTTRPPLLARGFSVGGTARHSRGHAGAPQGPKSPLVSKHSNWESRRGSQVVLEFADPTSTPQTHSHLPPTSSQGSPPAYLGGQSSQGSQSSSPSLSRRPSHHWPSQRRLSGHVETPPPSQTRLQATFEAIKKMGSGLTSPRVDFGYHNRDEDKKNNGEGSRSEDGWGYFDVVPEVVEA